MAMPSSSKPAPLGYGSPRSSPFRRPESPAAASPLRQSTPPASPSKVAPLRTPSRFANDSAPSNPAPEGARPRGGFGQPVADMPAPKLASPAHIGRQAAEPVGTGNALSKLQPAQVRVLRDGFQILDRDSDGVVNREDIADMLNQLGLPSAQSEISSFFPAGSQQTMTLAAFLNSLSTTLAAMSDSSELLSAFSAFDDDDSGQVDLLELRNALLNTAPEPGERALSSTEVDKIMAGFSGRRAFSKSAMAGGMGKRGEVFKYHDFVNSIVGGGSGSEPASQQNSED